MVSLLGVLSWTGSCASAGWTTSSSGPVTSLSHPTIDALVETLSPPADFGYQFVVFGDQRALADGEWQEMMRHIGNLSATNDRLLFMIDTGDII